MQSFNAAYLASLPPATRAAILADLPPATAKALLTAWRFWARPEQLAPGSPGAANPRKDWTFWLLLCGRGFGKTRTGAEWVQERAKAQPGSHGALVAATFPDAQKVMLSFGLEGQPDASGLLAVAAPDFRPRYEISRNRLVWPNGTVADLYTAEEPGRLRGPQHHWAWVDEIAAWEKEAAAWDQLLFGLRLGEQPQAVITTTPRPIPIVRDLLKNPRCVVTRGGTRDNAANLSPAFFAEIVAKYEGTRLGRQELDGEVLEDVEGALWTWSMIEACRREEPPKLRRVVVAIDPAVSNTEGSDETGIVVVGVGDCMCKGGPRPELHGFVLEDLSGKYTPDGWARAAIGAFRRHRADRVVAEVNNGGDLVEANLRTVDRNIPYTAVRASRGKRVRAEPVAALYEQGRMHHAEPFAKLETQLCEWDPMGDAASPDRLDALVWGATEVMLVGEESTASKWVRGYQGR